MGLLSSAFGSGGGGADYEKAISAIQGVRLPSAEEMRVQLQELVSAGEITPIQAENILQEASSFEKMELDPYTRAAQMRSLEQLQEIGEAEGLDPIAKAKMLEAREQMETSARGMREAGMQRAQERGIGGSGLELASQLLGDQAAAGRASRDATMAAAEAQRRSLEAITQSGQLGGQIRSQDYGQAADKAAAIDAINRFNTLTRQGTQEANIGRRTAADYANLAERQRLSDFNLQQENVNRQRNADLIQREFENRMAKQSALANIYGQQAQAEAARKQGDRAFLGGLIGTGGALLGTAFAGPVGGYVGQQAGQMVAGGGGGGGAQGGGGGYQYQPGQFGSAYQTQRPQVQQNAYGPRLPQQNQGGFMNTQVMPRKRKSTNPLDLDYAGGGY